MSKDMLRELLEDYFDERRAYVEVLQFYNEKVETSDNIVWKMLRDDMVERITELDIDIQDTKQKLTKDLEN